MIKDFIESAVNRKSFTLSGYTEPYQRDWFTRVSKIMATSHTLMSRDEALHLVSAVVGTSFHTSPMAEVGVYKGGSARMMREFDTSNRRLDLFDTFKGLPEGDGYHVPGQYRGTLDDIRGISNSRIYKGRFEKTKKSLDPQERYSLVNIDVDLKVVLRDCLNFFYSRIVNKGMMVVHDYCEVTGSKRLIDEFARDHGCIVIAQSGTQCYVIP